MVVRNSKSLSPMYSLWKIMSKSRSSSV